MSVVGQDQFAVGGTPDIHLHPDNTLSGFLAASAVVDVVEMDVRKPESVLSGYREGHPRWPTTKTRLSIGRSEKTVYKRCRGQYRYWLEPPQHPH